PLCRVCSSTEGSSTSGTWKTDRVRMATPAVESMANGRGNRDRVAARASEAPPKLAGSYTIWPSVRKTAAFAAWQSRAALCTIVSNTGWGRSEEHTSELQSRGHLVCRLLLEKKKNGRRR